MSANEISLSVSPSPIPRIPDMSFGIGRLWSRLSAGDSCVDRLAAKYPNMDSFSKSMVEILCQNQQKNLDPGYIYCSDDGIKAFSEALQSNTALESLSVNMHCIGSEKDCSVTLGLALSSALKVNRALKQLYVSMVNPAIMGGQALLQNLPCYNLASLTFDFFDDPTNTMMQAFSDAVQNNPYFPLESYSGYCNLNPSFRLMGEAFGHTQCLKNLGPIPTFSVQPQDMASFTAPAIGNSRIESYVFPNLMGYWTNATEQNAVLAAASKNICFRNFTLPSQPGYPYPDDFVSKLQTIVQNRLPCTPDPKCSVPAKCSGPTPPTPTPDPSSPSSGMSLGTVLAIAIPSTAAVSVGLTLLVQRVLAKIRGDDPMKRPLI